LGKSLLLGFIFPVSEGVIPDEIEKDIMRQLTVEEREKFEELKKRTPDHPADPIRVNIIFHGLLVFRDLDADHYEVLIPKTDGCHKAKYGNPCVGDLKEFNVPGPYGPGPAYFSFEGITAEPTLRRSFPNATNTVVIRNSPLTPQYQNVRIIIKVPKPFIIRHYRGGETHGTPLATDPDTMSVLLRSPDVIHEVTVFSYVSFFQPTLVGPGVSYPIPQPNPQRPVLNIGIYSQPDGVCANSDDAFFNSMFKVNANKDLNVDVSASTIGTTRVDDGPPLWTSLNVGISVCEFLALSEFHSWVYRLFCPVCGAKAIAEKDFNLEALRDLADVQMMGAIPGGCGSGFACDDGQ
jgi:hypothetical protein